MYRTAPRMFMSGITVREDLQVPVGTAVLAESMVMSRAWVTTTHCSYTTRKRAVSRYRT